RPIYLDATCCTKRQALPDEAATPIDHRTEDIKRQCLHLRNIVLSHSLSLWCVPRLGHSLCMSRMGTINAACRLSNAWCSSLGKLGRDLAFPLKPWTAVLLTRTLMPLPCYT